MIRNGYAGRGNLKVAQKTASRTEHTHLGSVETMVLTKDEALRFLRALANPPRPNDRLRAALEEHSRRVVSR